MQYARKNKNFLANAAIRNEFFTETREETNDSVDKNSRLFILGSAPQTPSFIPRKFISQ